MLTLIHGDHLTASRAKLMELKSDAKDKEIREISGKKLDSNALVQALTSSSLFGGEILVIIEGFIGNAKKREKAFSNLLAQIIASAKETDIILYEDKEIEKGTLSKLGSALRPFLFKLPSVIFQFLDSIAPGNAKTSLTLLSQVISQEVPEVVFALLVRRVRQLIMLKDGVTPPGMQSWQVGRLTSQAQHFTIEQLVVMHTSLLDIDTAIKTGSSPFVLTQRIEQLLISL